MTVVRCRLFKIFQPFLQLSVPANLKRRQHCPGALDFAAKLRIHVEHRRCFHTRAEQRINENPVAGRCHRFTAHSASRRDEGVFGRIRRAGHQPSVRWMLNHVGKEELCCIFEDRVEALPQKHDVFPKPIVLPHLQSDPNPCGYEDPPPQSPAGRRISPWICNRMRYPSRRTVHGSCGAASRFSQTLDQTKQWSLTF